MVFVSRSTPKFLTRATVLTLALQSRPINSLKAEWHRASDTNTSSMARQSAELAMNAFIALQSFGSGCAGCGLRGSQAKLAGEFGRVFAGPEWAQSELVFVRLAGDQELFMRPRAPTVIAAHTLLFQVEV